MQFRSVRQQRSPRVLVNSASDLKFLLASGSSQSSRKILGRVFGHQMRFDLAAGFPLVTTKKVHTRSVFAELLWFLRGDTNVKWLQDRGVSIWDEWADDDGDLGPGLRLPVAVLADPGRPARRPDRPGRRRRSAATPTRAGTSSRAWNVADIPQMALAPCHTMFQFYVADGPAVLPALPALRRRLPRRAVQHRVVRPAHRTWSPRSPVSSVGDFVHTLGDAHLYSNHLDQARLQLDPRAAAAADAAARPVGHRRSTRSTSSTSRSRATTRTRASRPRSPYEASTGSTQSGEAGRDGRRGRRQRRDRPGRRHPVAASPRTSSTSGRRPADNTVVMGRATTTASATRCPTARTSWSPATRTGRPTASSSARASRSGRRGRRTSTAT